MPSDATLDVNDTTLNRMILEMANGEYRIPEFQREYVWAKSDVTSLFDSVYNSYPIGSIFAWKVPRDMNQFFRNLHQFDQPPIEDTGKQISFVLDGQQRLISLYLGLNGLEFDDYDYSRVAFDMDNEEFTLSSAAADRLISMSDVWDAEKRVEVKSKDEIGKERQLALEDCYNQFNNYKLPIIEVDTPKFEEVIDIFERINQEGQDLSRFDIVHANLWTDEFSLRRRIDEDIIEPLKDKGFGTVERETVSEAVSLALEKESKTEVQKSLETDEVKKNWSDIKDSFINAVRYIRQRYNIKRVEFLPYESLIGIFAYYMYRTQEKTVKLAHQDQIDQYFWRIIVSDHWERGRQTAIGGDIALIDKVIDGVDVSIDFAPAITPEKLKNSNIKRSKSSIRNAFLCILANENPRNFEDGTPIDLSQDLFTSFQLENHHIFPNAYLRQLGFDKQDRKSVVDITFLPRNVNNEISDSAPSEYFSDYKDRDDFDEIMASHLIPYGPDSAIWTNDFEKFLEQRCAVVMDRVRELIGGSLELDSEDLTDKQKIDRAKDTVRDLIHEKLAENNDGSYWEVLPSGIVDNVSQRTNQSTDDGREKLNHVTMEEAADIIQIHWSVFSDIFPNEDDVEYHFKNIQKYDKAYQKDNLDRYIELDGRLAIDWVNSCVPYSG